ncbi:threonine ammonia-lyase [Labilithrix luteola]|uniref:threonine ammonia-lyase n=1 Tax=Labilithrix luteola TaxID=1391654 RepID=UPI001474EB0F|nr:pyridoxal-phosphate dependent enzyme [Labilithrix luteola]
MSVPSLARFEEARSRIARHVLATPIVRLRRGRAPAGAGDVARGIGDVPVAEDRLPRDLLLKLESLQVTGSFKARGALSRVLSLSPEALQRGIVTASGGNHGLAVAYAGHVVGAPTTVYLPERTTAEKAARIERWGARVHRAGAVWDDAHAAALEHAARDGLTYVHPFADPDVVAGQGTVALEALEQIPEVDLFIVAIGGGGLAAGVASAVKRKRPEARIIGVEPVGAPTLFESLRAGHVVELPEVRTAAGTLAPRRSDPYVFDILKETLSTIVLVTDDEMRAAARFLLTEVGIGAELSGAAALSAVLSNKADLGGAKHPCVLVCGAGSDALG